VKIIVPVYGHVNQCKMRRGQIEVHWTDSETSLHHPAEVRLLADAAIEFEAVAARQGLVGWEVASDLNALSRPRRLGQVIQFKPGGSAAHSAPPQWTIKFCAYGKERATLEMATELLISSHLFKRNDKKGIAELELIKQLVQGRESSSFIKRRLDSYTTVAEVSIRAV
jgi:hypothetical protein